MEFIFKFQRIAAAFLFLGVLVAASYGVEAALSAEEYWRVTLPKTQIPKAVKDLLPSSSVSEWEESKEAAVSVGKGGVNVDAGKPGGGGAAVNVGHGGVGVRTARPGGGPGTVVGVSPGGGVNVGTRTRRGKPVIVSVHPGWNPFQYLYAATETQLKNDPNVALFFLQKDLRTGRKMNLEFSETSKYATFLPRSVADSIPFSSNKLPEILEKFSLKPESDEAKVVKTTIQECEAKAMEGEEKFCATSLESMVDLTVSKLGKGVNPVSTTADAGGRKEYRISQVRKRSKGSEAVVCHRQEYAYAVFLCHKTSTTLVYDVEMVARDGSKADAVAVCHRDTAKWNPKHLAFQVLKVQPGTVPVCHFLPQDHVVWVVSK